MNPIIQHRLIQDIFFSLETNHNAKEIVSILSGYGITNESINDYSQTEIKKLLGAASTEILLLIADNLKIDTSNYIEQIPEDEEGGMLPEKKYLKKIFISHSHKDKEIVLSFIDMLEAIGIHTDQILCTSIPGYGIPLGKNFIQEIKTELDENVMVFFMLSENFYESPMCLIEMGAAWVKTKDQIPVVIKPFQFEQIEGVFKNSQGIEIDNEEDYDLLKETLENTFNTKSKRHVMWSRDKRKIIGTIQDQLEGLI